MRQIVWLVLVLMLAGCAATGVPLTKVASAPEGGARIYIYRKLQFIDGGMYPTVSIDGKKIGDLKTGGYLTVPLRAGVHALALTGGIVHWAVGPHYYKFETVPGETLYYRIDFEYGGAFHIRRVKPSKAKKELVGLKGTQHASTAPAGQVVNIDAPGNLQVLHKVGCVSLDKASDHWTPADIYPAVGKCVASGDYKKATALFALAGVYAAVDIQRVSDKTADDAHVVLIRETFAKLSKAQRSRFMSAARRLAKTPSRLQAVCSAVGRVGPPDYVPTYMIQHGMGAFLGEKTKGGLVPHFDMAHAWHRAMHQYLHCPTP